MPAVDGLQVGRAKNELAARTDQFESIPGHHARPGTQIILGGRDMRSRRQPLGVAVIGAVNWADAVFAVESRAIPGIFAVCLVPAQITLAQEIVFRQ